MAGFVDVHSHMVPSGDDGVQTVEEGLRLLRETRRRGTTLQFATPHVNRIHVLTPARERAVREAHAEMAAALAPEGLELQLGWELSPQRWLLDDDPVRLRLGDLDACLLEFPLRYSGARDLDLLMACAEHIEAAGLVPVLAHPERSHLVHDDPGELAPFAERGWPLQVNASSILGDEGTTNQAAGWRILDDAPAPLLVSSDGHRAARPPYLDEAYRAVTARLGETRADELFRGSALAGISRSPSADPVR